MWQSILKGALTVGGNMLFPGAGSVAGSIVDAALPSETQPSAGAQAQQGTDWGKIGGAAFGLAGGIAGNLLSKPSVDPMKQQLELAYRKKVQDANQDTKNKFIQSLGGTNANVQ